MKTKINVSVLSFAHGHLALYCEKMRTFDDVRLVSAWDDDPVRGKRNADLYGMHFVQHIEDVLNDPSVDVVMIGSETNRHAELVEAAAHFKKAILLQKPMAITLEDCDRIIEVVERSGVYCSIAYQMRCDPSNQKIKELVESGVLGKIGLLRRRHCISVLFQPDFIHGPSRWHLDPEKNLGMFMDDASHAADFMYWILGRPTRVFAEIDNILSDVAPDDSGVAVYRFPDKAMGILVNSSVALAGENTTEIYGDQGVLIQNYDDLVSTQIPPPPGAIALKLYRRGARSWEDLHIPIPASHRERIMAVPRRFLDDFKRDRPPMVNCREGRISVEMILGAYRSSKEGRRIDFPL